MSLLAGAAMAMPEYPTTEAALKAIGNDGRSIVLDFTGTDWCTACIHLRDKIMGTAEFEKALGDKLVLVEVDFPRTPALREQITPEEWERRENWLASYALEALPAVVLLDDQGLPYGVIRGTRPTPATYIQLVQEAMKARDARDEALKKAATLQGMEKAKALAAALELLPVECRDKYAEVIGQITELDPEDTLGYRGTVDITGRRVRQLNALRALTSTFAGKLSAAEVKESIVQLDAFLAQPHLVPEAKQKAVLCKADGYALLRDYENQLSCMREAIEIDPDSRAGKKAKRDVDFLEQHVLPHLLPKP
ncbi:MAG: hypothetical protein II349_01145 [Akkermansia sp.]|nr:hypothetical protein [Akkermansia sp.]